LINKYGRKRRDELEKENYEIKKMGNKGGK
jgi:hypothetical protein